MIDYTELFGAAYCLDHLGIVGMAESNKDDLRQLVAYAKEKNFTASDKLEELAEKLMIISQNEGSIEIEDEDLLESLFDYSDAFQDELYSSLKIEILRNPEVKGVYLGWVTKGIQRDAIFLAGASNEQTFDLNLPGLEEGSIGRRAIKELDEYLLTSSKPTRDFLDLYNQLIDLE